MMTLSRSAIRPLLDNAFSALRRAEPHCGLLLAKGLASFPEGDKAGETKAGHIRAIADLPVSDFYQLAFARWERATADAQRFAAFRLALAGRLYIGVVRDNALETGVTVSHTYGMPLLPGSAVKGLCRASAGRWLDNVEACRWLFGNDPGEEEGTAEVGGLIFHDAWWVPEPGQKPFVREIITVHHPDYYGSEGRDRATDFDSPVPSPQIAVRGSFHFVIEGQPLWTRLARRLLEEGLRQHGVGSKRSSGYGRFTGNEE